MQLKKKLVGAQAFEKITIIVHVVCEIEAVRSAVLVCF